MNAVRTGLLASIVFASAVSAQRPDSARATPASAQTNADSLKPPIGPRRAFLYSFLLPGYSQSVLGRHKAASTFLFVEGIALVMIRESAADVHEARRTVNDTVVVSYVDANGAAHLTTEVPRYTDVDIRARRAHVEDWIALLVANHLFAGADAFVAAHLWDVPVRLGLRLTPGRATVNAALKW
jgi:hypothetical protein